MLKCKETNPDDIFEWKFLSSRKIQAMSTTMPEVPNGDLKVDII
jgi:hypothetical protein